MLIVLLRNMLCQDFSITVFYLKHDILIIKHTSSRMLSFLHCSDSCWECEFDTDVKIETYYQHDGEQLGLYKKVHTLESRIIFPPRLVIFRFFSTQDIFTPPPPTSPAPLIFSHFLPTFLRVNNYFHHSPSQRKRNCAV